ncbi:hypothetical protein JTB14_001592 [Gonioctena quinquepunctata]|nr:hypothetical protein JTB14_001592 [Gonioctena quinquepunctata]
MKRFLKILRFLHLADNEQMPKKGEDGYNKLYKVQPLLTHLSTKFKANFAPSRFISIDESMVAFKGDITVYKWEDRSTKPVIVASNMHDPSDKAMVQRRNKRREKEDIICPRAIRDYNLHMGGVDRFDQLHSTYNISWESRRWWMKLFFYFLDAAVVNSYIMYKTQYKSENHASKCMTHLQFRSCLIDQLIFQYTKTRETNRWRRNWSNK